MKKVILLIGPLATFSYYAAEIQGHAQFAAILCGSYTEAFKVVHSKKYEISAVVTNLFGYHGPEFGTRETDDYSFTGAVVARDLREECPKAMFFIFGAAARDRFELAEYAGETADIICLDADHSVDPVTLIKELEAVLCRTPVS